MDRYGPEISDLIVDYDPHTLERRDVDASAVMARLAEARVPARARRIAASLGTGRLDRERVDGVLVRSHLELQRLHEEFRTAANVRAAVLPIVSALRAAGTSPIRIVDLGCGGGYIVRWLAAHGELGPDVELVGVDYNRALVTAAQRLAEVEHLRCTFVVGNAFALAQPAHVIMSTGVLHHFRGDDLVALFAQHAQAEVAAFVHTDIRPSRVAPLGSWIFHRARMREPLAQFDGYWSTVRAHDAATLRGAITRGAPAYALGMLDARPGLRGLMRIFHCVIGVRPSLLSDLATAYTTFGRRFEAA